MDLPALEVPYGTGMLAGIKIVSQIIGLGHSFVFWSQTLQIMDSKILHVEV